MSVRFASWFDLVRALSAMRRVVYFAITLGALCPAMAMGQSSPSEFTYATRYDGERRVVGTIAPDPDGSGPIRYGAVRNTYDASGDLVRVEKGELSAWQTEAVAPASWTGFTVFVQVDLVYDAAHRKLSEAVAANGNTYSLTQYSYSAMGQQKCSAVRMNPAAYGSLPASACSLGAEGSVGPDRITATIYDAAGRLLKTVRAHGTPLQQDYATYTYSANGKPLTVRDSNGNLSGYGYDGFDRLAQWSFPSKTATGSINTTDYEAYTYDPNGNRLTFRKRDGRVLTYSYDALNRITSEIVPDGGGLDPSTTRDIYYGYDLRGLKTYARFNSASGEGIANSYDGFGRLTSTTSTMGGVSRTLSYGYDADDNRNKIVWPDGGRLDSSYDGLDRQTYTGDPINGIFGWQVIFDSQGRPTYQFAGNSGYKLFGYDAISRPNSLTSAFTLANVVSQTTLSYNPAGQIIQQGRSNDSFVYTDYLSVNRNYTANGLNQYGTAGPASFSYDANGNLTGDATNNYVYDVENRLVSASNGTSLNYDPLGRLDTVKKAGATTQFLYDGDQIVAEYDAAGTMRYRYAHGPGDDDPRIQYTGSSMAQSAMRFHYLDQIGSIIALADSTGSSPAINRYDEYGIPAPTNAGRFQYTGQAWLPELGMYYYKARIYSPTLGRFLQTDPIGYKDQINLYAYVGNDPVNKTDPTGTQEILPGDMEHIINAHGSDTPRTREGNSTFTPEYSNPAALQGLAKDVFASPNAPPSVAPFGKGTIMQMQGQVLLKNTQTGQTIPYPIGKDGNGNPTNQVLIRYQKATGNVVQMFPVPMVGKSSGPSNAGRPSTPPPPPPPPSWKNLWGWLKW